MDQANQQPDIKRIFGNILLVFAALLLPGAAWSFFGWIHLFLPLLVFVFIIKYGELVGLRFILAASGLALLAGLIGEIVESILFSLSMLPAGYIVARSGLRSESPALAGLKGAVVQGASWFILLTGIGMASGISAYGSLIEALNSGIDEALAHYSQSSTLAPDAMVMLEATLYQMKVIVPIIMPALFFSCALFSTWITMVLGNRLAYRVFDHSIWPGYRYWKLPDKLIWLAIGSAAILVLPFENMRSVGINALILISIVYCFQGFAVTVFFMNKWKVPLLFRSFIYAMIVLQSFGTLLLLIVGVADIWMNLRKLGQDQSEQYPNNTTDE